MVLNRHMRANPGLRINGEVCPYFPNSLSYNAGENGMLPFISADVYLGESCEMLFNDWCTNKKKVEVFFEKPVKHCLVFEDMGFTPGQRDFTASDRRISVIWKGCKKAALRIE